MGSLEHFKQVCGISDPVTIMYYVINYPKCSGLDQNFVMITDFVCLENGHSVAERALCSIMSRGSAVKTQMAAAGTAGTEEFTSRSDSQFWCLDWDNLKAGSTGTVG